MMDKSTYEVRLTQWAKIVQASNERPSTQLLKDWLFDNNISKDQFYYWQRKVRSEAYQRLSPLIRKLLQSLLPKYHYPLQRCRLNPHMQQLLSALVRQG